MESVAASSNSGLVRSNENNTFVRGLLRIPGSSSDIGYGGPGGPLPVSRLLLYDNRLSGGGSQGITMVPGYPARPTPLLLMGWVMGEERWSVRGRVGCEACEGL